MEGFNDLHPEQQQQILQGPAMQPPDDDPPQFDNPPNQNAFGIAIVTLCLVITAFCFLVRAYSRIFILRRIRLEDGASVADFVLKLMFADFRKAVGFLAMVWFNSRHFIAKIMNRIMANYRGFRLSTSLLFGSVMRWPIPLDILSINGMYDW
jgi:hypothetical protein